MLPPFASSPFFLLRNMFLDRVLHSAMVSHLTQSLNLLTISSSPPHYQSTQSPLFLHLLLQLDRDNRTEVPLWPPRSSRTDGFRGVERRRWHRLRSPLRGRCQITRWTHNGSSSLRGGGETDDRRRVRERRAARVCTKYELSATQKQKPDRRTDGVSRAIQVEISFPSPPPP